MEIYKVSYTIGNLNGLGYMHIYLSLDPDSEVSIKDQAYNHVYHNCQIYKQKLLSYDEITVTKLEWKKDNENIQSIG